MTLEDWNTLFQVGSVVLLGLTFAVGAATIWTGIALSKRQAAQIESTREGAAKALANAASANERAGNLEVEAAKQRERAARAERELLQLRQRVAPRRLSAEQHSLIVSTMRQAPGTLSLFRIGDAEATMFANDLIAALREAGWSVNVTNIGTRMPPPYGLIYVTSASAPIPREVQALSAVLHRAGIEVTAETSMDPTSYGLLVGLKPVAR